LPGYSCITDHLNVVVNRSVTLLTRPLFWILFALICVLNVFLWPAGFPGNFLFYPALLLFYIVYSVEGLAASPLLPYSRLERAVAVLTASLLALLLFLTFFLLTWHVTLWLDLQIHGSQTVGNVVMPRDMILALLLSVPAFFLVHLLLSVLKTGVMFVFSISTAGCMILSMTVAAMVASSGGAGAGLAFWPWLAVGWGLYLLLLYLRFSRGSIEQR
jgi:hypothetical protein